jgi:hypothetical protein
MVSDQITILDDDTLGPPQGPSCEEVIMRTTLYAEEIPATWPEVVAQAGHSVDHIHGMIRLDDGDEHVIHLSSCGEPQGPQTLMAESYSPQDFEQLSLDEE